MCRWFAYISPAEECLLEDVLIVPAHSLTKQVNEHYLPYLLHHDPHNVTTEQEVSVRNRLFNIDGFGVSYYTTALTTFNNDPADDGQKRPALYKVASPPLHDQNFLSLCANTSSTAVFAHIRAATATPIAYTNNHPFAFGRHVFMHNGVISDFVKVSRQLSSKIADDAYAHIQGSTDSEHIAALYITFLTEEQHGKDAWQRQYPVTQMKHALERAIAHVFATQLSVLGDAMEPSSLNLCASDGEQMVAVRVRNHTVEQPPSLYYSTIAGVTLNRKFPDHPDGVANPGAFLSPSEHGRHVIVASEPSTYNKKDWTLVEKNHAVLVSKDGRARVEEVSVPREVMISRPASKLVF